MSWLFQQVAPNRAVGYSSASVGLRRCAAFVTGKNDEGSRQVTDAEITPIKDTEDTQVLNINLAVTCSLSPVVVCRLLIWSFLLTVVSDDILSDNLTIKLREYMLDAWMSKQEISIIVFPPIACGIHSSAY